MSAIYWIAQRFVYIRDHFYDLYLDSSDIPVVGSYISISFYWLYRRANDLVLDFYNFADWVVDITDRVSNILSWSTIWNLIRSYIPNLEELDTWFYSWAYHVREVVTSWWSYTQLEVKVWVAEVREWSSAQLSSILTTLGDLVYEWSSFKTRLPSILAVVNWFPNWWSDTLTNINLWWSQRLPEVQSLIDSAFIIRSNLWSDWQEWRTPLTEFISDPLKWFYDRLDDFVERFW